MRHWLRCCLYASVITTSTGSLASVRGDDQGFSRLNAVGRYFGVGYSHYGYHSGSAGRLPRVQQNHPASAYPSTYRPSPFQPAEFAYRPQPHVHYAPQVHTSPTIITGPTKAPELEPIGPPPKWLEPYLKEGEDDLPSPGPKVRSVPSVKSPAVPAPAGVTPPESSPSDRSTSPPGRGLIDESNDDLLEDADQLLEEESDILFDESAALQSAVRHRQASSRVKHQTPDIQSNIHRYTPFR